MLLSIVVAMAENRVIGRKGMLPWHLPEDLRFFKRVTLGKPVVMGRKTHESIGRPLPERRNIIVTRDADYDAPGCIITHSIDEAFSIARPAAEIMLIGGATLYAQTLDRADRIYLTLVQAEVEGDVRFPPLNWRQWRECWRKNHSADAHHTYAFSFILLERRYQGSPEATSTP